MARLGPDRGLAGDGTVGRHEQVLRFVGLGASKISRHNTTLAIVVKKRQIRAELMKVKKMRRST
jgi:hypothetical protein